MICVLMKKINILKTKSKKIFGSVGLVAAIFILMFAIIPRVQEARAESVQDKINAYINFISYYLPSKTLSNSDISLEHPEWSIDKISSKTGMQSSSVQPG